MMPIQRRTHAFIQGGDMAARGACGVASHMPVLILPLILMHNSKTNARNYQLDAAPTVGLEPATARSRALCGAD
jgi:hypothetical protein